MRSILFIILVLISSQAKGSDMIDMNIISEIESSNNPDAYNRISGAVGLYQITSICLQDYNEYHKKQYKLEEMYDPKKNFKVASWYFNVRIPQMLAHFKIEDKLETRILSYNAGILYAKKGIYPTESSNYIVKYKRLYLEKNGEKPYRDYGQRVKS